MDNRVDGQVNIPCCGEFLNFKNKINEYTESTFFNCAEGDSCIVSFDQNITNKMVIDYYPEYEEYAKDSLVFDFNFCPFCGSRLTKG